MKTVILKNILFISFYFICGASGAATLGESLSFKGDIRFRNEWIKEENKQDRIRQRLRGRFGFVGHPNEKVQVLAQVATSEGNSSTSTNASFGGSESAGMKKDLAYIDSFYFNWQPSESMSVLGGKFGIPFYRAGNSEMIWDSDVTGEGLAFTHLCQCSESFSWFGNIATLWSKENHGSTATSPTYADEVMLGLQLGMKKSFDQFQTTFGVSFYDFNNTHGVATGTYNGPYSSISTDTDGYQLLNPFLEMTFNYQDKPFTLYFDQVTNKKQDSKSSAHTIGLKYNKAKEVNSWDLDIYYRLVQPKAVIKEISDGDIGSSDVEAVRTTLGYMIAQNSLSKISYAKTTRNHSLSTKTSYDFAHIDFIFSF